MKVPVTLTINGVAHALEVAPNATLLDVLRRDLGLTGAKESCLEGRCGACTVLLDGRAVNACLLLAASADGRAVTTIEGLGRGGDLHPLQQAFLEHGALQCGYCTPGMIMAGVALLASVPHPDEETIRRALHGNLCRCTGYARIVAAVQAAAAAPAAEGGRRAEPGAATAGERGGRGDGA